MLNDLNKLSLLAKQNDVLKKLVQFEILTEVSHQDQKYPICSFTIGSQDPSAPTLFITGGIHGLERIGAQLAWSLLKTTMDRLTWDSSLQSLFGQVRLVVLPLVNPVGYLHFKRCNGNDVDLMRNSPVKAIDPVPFLLGGQRLSKTLPWYQGAENELEEENKVLFQQFFKTCGQSRCVISIDFHSGFGMKDRLWFPFSYTHRPFDLLAYVHSLNHLLEQTHPYHIYKVEPQGEGYLINGDMWDYIYLEHKSRKTNQIYLPFTLEMGSWNWVKKNPLQFFSKNGIFNPIKEHRLKRTYRRHHLLFDFLLKALYSHSSWAQLVPSQHAKHYQAGIARWYK